MAASSSYQLFDVRVLRRIALTPSLLRLVFTGEQVAQMRTYGPDQRIKLFFPLADGSQPRLTDRPDWYSTYRAMPDAVRPPMRTYTIRALRPEAAEVDVDFVLHGDSGPASRWAQRAQPGDFLQLWAPTAADAGDSGGYEWRPPVHASEVLVVADETALPAAAGILEALANWPKPPKVRALIEVPHAADEAYPIQQAGLPLPVQWLPRDAGDAPAAYGDRLLQALRSLSLEGPQAEAAQPLSAVDVDRDILWEQASVQDGGFYAWIAGEAGAVMRIRRHLLGERGIDRSAITLMGYWRQGRALD